MANRLAYVLRRTPAKDVNVRFSQVQELIGLDKAKDLALFIVGKSEVKHTKVGKRSAIPAEKRVSSNNLAQYNRIALLEAIEAEQGADFQIDGTEDPNLTTSVPNPALLPKALKAELKGRGYKVG